MRADKPNLLFITPTVPEPAGNGRAMRAFHTIALLAARYRVYLLIVSRELAGKELLASPALSALCQGIAGVPIDPFKDIRMLAQVRLYKLSPWWFHQCFSPARSPYLTPGVERALFRRFPGISFDVIHGFRLSVLPFVRVFVRAGHGGGLQLDLDDIESLTALRLSRLSRENGRRKMARAYAYDARHCRFLEKEALALFHRVFVCSRIDRERLARAYGHGQVSVIPNRVAVPDIVPRKPPDGPFTFLFVGTLGYYPNAEGILYFCRQVLPILQKAARRDFRVRIVGSGATRSFRNALASVPAVEVVGRVPEVAPWYAAADAAIVPLRAGGGTRIKVLEAFAHQCPVVSTPLGVEGIDGRPGEHFLAADTSRAFAMQCRRMIAEPRLRERLARNAHRLVRARYSLEAVQREGGAWP